MSLKGFRVRWHGGFQVVRSDGSQVRFPTRKTASVAARLLWSGEAVPRSRLASDHWPEVESARAHVSLRKCLSSIRNLLGSESIVTNGDAVRIDLALFEFEEFDRSLPFAPEIDDDWAEGERARLGLRSERSESSSRAPVQEFLTSLDYLIDLNPAGAVAFASTAAPVWDEAPLEQIVPQLERLVARQTVVDESQLRLRVLLTTKYHLQARLRDAATCLRGIIRDAEALGVEGTVQTAAYHLFATWILLDEHQRAGPLLAWLQDRASPAVRLAAASMWAFQNEGGEAASRALAESAAAARIEGDTPAEQRALVSLIATGEPVRLEPITERLEELRSASPAGIGDFAAAYAHAKLLQQRGLHDAAIALLAALFERVQIRGEQRLALGSLLYLAGAHLDARRTSLAAECLGAWGCWIAELGVPWLTSERREHNRLEARLQVELGTEGYRRASARGKRAWTAKTFRPT